jgi:hypothetical protein
VKEKKREMKEKQPRVKKTIVEMIWRQEDARRKSSKSVLSVETRTKKKEFFFF